MPARSLKGGCYCRATTYTISISEKLPLLKGTPYHAPVCSLDHCEDYRKAAGSLFQAWIIVPEAWLQITSGEVNGASSITRFESSPDVFRSFCSKCGTHLFYENLKRKAPLEGEEEPVFLVDITIGSLDEESLNETDLVKPRMNLWCDFGISWVQEMLRDCKGGFGVLRKYPTGNIRHTEEDLKEKFMAR